jgi:hypothetical protein
MKEYIAETGGRYTYSDDILNLQELALSMSVLFEGCSHFIISGCEISGNEISPGYVWINGKVRRFDGCRDAVFPYYIYEKNSYDTVVYASEVNKRGRGNYLCLGGSAVPTTPDAVTGLVPGFIELKPDYAPRLIDRFFGKYALLLDTPFAKQTVKKELVLTGKFSGEKEIESKTAVSVVNSANGYCLKNTVRENGDVSIGVYLNGLLVNEIVIKTDGSFGFMKQGKEIASVNESGIAATHFSAATSKTGSILIYGSHLINLEDASDEGAININSCGFQKSGAKFRNFNVYNGKTASISLFSVEGKTETVHVNASFIVNNTGNGFILKNKTYPKTDKRLINTFSWADSAGETVAFMGYDTADSFDFTLKNSLGNITIHPNGFLNIAGELKINGTDIDSIYVSQTAFNTELGKKVTAIAGKGLSTEDFTSEYKNKLDGITSGNLNGGNGSGFALALEVATELAKKLSISENLADLANKAAARTNLDVYSKTESGNTFLKISGNLLELVSLSADEMNSLSAEQILSKKAEKQTAVRNNIDAEKKGTGDLKLAMASNLSDLPDKATARSNISVYSKTETDTLLAGKLSTAAAYTGEIFTTTHKTKLEAIKTGNFQGTNAQGQTVNQSEGYVLVSDAVKELNKKANLLMDNYSSDQKTAIAGNLNVYQKTVADAKFATLENLFQDFITYLVKQGKTTAEAQKTLRDKLNVPGKEDVTDNYLRKDGKLADLVLADSAAQKTACQKLGAAYAAEYQTKLTDTGWLQMANSGNSTDTSRLFIRQTGNIVCIQGIINTGKRDGGNWGGTVAVIPNQVSPPKYGLRVSYADYNDSHVYNRGSSFVIQGNSRKILLYERGWNNVNTEINFTYMT